MKYEKNKISIDKYVWRCYNKSFPKYKKRFWLRFDLIFKNVKIKLKKVLIAIILLTDNIDQKAILRKLGIYYGPYRKIIDYIIKKIRNENLENPILIGGPNTIV